MLVALPGLSERDLKENLNGIAAHKCKILTLTNDETNEQSNSAKSSGGKGPEKSIFKTQTNLEKITVKLNKNFISKAVKINMVATTKQVRIDDNTTKQIHKTIEQDRRHEIEAAVVRIMKSRKNWPTTSSS